MNKNTRSLPHESKNGYHVDVYSFRDGQVKPEKLHELINGPKVKPNSIEGLRQRLNSQKGY